MENQGLIAGNNGVQVSGIVMLADGNHWLQAGTAGKYWDDLMRSAGFLCGQGARYSFMGALG